MGKTNLSIQNDALLLVNPEILLHKPTILPREKAVCEANETVGRGHPCANKTGRTFELLCYLNTWTTGPCESPRAISWRHIYTVFNFLFFPVAFSAVRWSVRKMDCVRDKSILHSCGQLRPLRPFFKREPPSSAHRLTDRPQIQPWSVSILVFYDPTMSVLTLISSRLA